MSLLLVPSLHFLEEILKFRFLRDLMNHRDSFQLSKPDEVDELVLMAGDANNFVCA